jgi:hypothetical protein
VVEADGSAFKWKHGADTSFINKPPKTLAEGHYILESISGSLSGTDVTFREDPHVGADRLTFHFDTGGDITALSTRSNMEGESYTHLYTFLPTYDEEILATIQKTYEEATQ